MKHVIFILGISILLQSCLVSRTNRPKLTGYIFDVENKKPISKCKVGESYTDATGYYNLKEKRYREFTWFGMEAPPVFVIEIVEKEGYITDTIKRFYQFGGAARKGAHWQMDTIFLKKIN